MGKIIFFIISICLCGISYADLGPIQVNSYLSQKLNATIPITKLPADADYGNLSIGLAGNDKFKSSGLTFNPELGYLLFKVIHNGNSAYLRVTSSRPINSPVLTFLLHYKLDNDDFYRQYTILLDPLEKISVAPVAGTNTQTPIIVYNSNQRPIPVSHNKVRGKTKLAQPNNTANQAVSFAPDFSNQFVKDRLANFNKDQFSYTTAKGDTLYVIARFLQLMYPKAGLTLNQVIIALGLENYNDLSKPDYAYPAGIEILLAKPENIVKISSSNADAYLWDASLNDGAKIALLQKMATQFDDEIQVESSILFAGTYVKLLESPVIVSVPKVNPTVANSNQKNSSSWLGIILGYKYAILAIILGILIISLLLGRLRRRNNDGYVMDVREPQPGGFFSRLFKRQHSPETNEIDKFDSIQNIDDDITINIVSPSHELSTSELDDIRSRKTESSANTEKPETGLTETHDQSEVTPESNVSKSANIKFNNEIDNELIATLEQILAFDDSREDIRYKLLELYLSADKLDKAQKVHTELLNRLDEDDPLRKNIISLCKRYDGFGTEDISSEQVPSSSNEPPMAAEKYTFSENESPVRDEESVSGLPAENISDSVKPEPTVLEFSPVQLNPVVEEAVEEKTFDNEDFRRSLDFANTSLNSESPIEKHSDTTVIESPVDGNLTAEVKTEADNLAILNTETIPDDHIEFNEPAFIQTEMVPATASLDDLSNMGQIESEADLVMDNLDEKINLAKMYYHIDEHAKAYELLMEIINTESSKPEAKKYASQLISDLGLHG